MEFVILKFQLNFCSQSAIIFRYISTLAYYISIPILPINLQNLFRTDLTEIIRYIFLYRLFYTGLLPRDWTFKKLFDLHLQSLSPVLYINMNRGICQPFNASYKRQSTTPGHRGVERRNASLKMSTRTRLSTLRFQ